MKTYGHGCKSVVSKRVDDIFKSIVISLPKLSRIELPDKRLKGSKRPYENVKKVL